MISAIAVIDLCVCVSERRILDEVSFHIQPGEWVAVVGANGAGKSTLLKTLLRIQPFHTGSVLLFGKPVQRESQRSLARHIGYVPQSPTTDVPFTVEEFVMAGRFTRQSRWRGFSRKDYGAVERGMVLIGVSDIRSRRVSTLSGGERQNVYIAAALAQETEIILFDEPTAFLDPGQKRKVQMGIETLHRETGKTIITVTHDINAAAHGPTRVIGLKEGQLVFDGPSAGLMDEDILSSVFSTSFSLAVHPETGRCFAMPEVLC